MLQVMWCLYCYIFLAFIASYVQASGQFQLNPLATLLNDVKSVHHNGTSHHVIILLAENRRCTQPTFMVRLSGKSLYILDLVRNNHTKPDVAVFRYPHLLDVGIYFLEVLTMYCEPLNPNDFANMCLVHPQDGRNVLTLPYSFEVTKAEHTTHPRPRWVLRHNETAAFLPTRYQKMCDGTFCVSEPSEIAQHNMYEWTDKPSYEHLVKKTLQRGLANLTTTITGRESISVCMVGASHASLLAITGFGLNISHLNFIPISNRYPQQFDLSILANCTYAVVGYGQWPLSVWMENQPYSAARYESLMRIVLSTIKASNVRTQVFTRSMNLNGLGYRYTSCPAGDYRHPPLVMMYNSIMAKVSAEYGVPHIDMFHIQGPLWDTALDWSHPYGRVATAEVEYIIHSILTYSHTHYRVPLLDPDFSSRVLLPHDPARVRFTDSDIVYLLVGDKFRAIPNHATMQHLGFNSAVDVYSPVVVIDPVHRLPSIIGPMLPDI